MKRTIQRYLGRFLLALLPRHLALLKWTQAEVDTLVILPSVKVLVPSARALCAEYEQFGGTTGEWKCHQVYAKKQKKFNNANKKDIKSDSSKQHDNSGNKKKP